MTVIKWEDPDFEMPPKENDRLTQEQILDIETWIKNGAPWPSQAAQKKILASEKNKRITKEGLIIKTSGGLTDDWTFRRYKPETVWHSCQSKSRPYQSGE